MKLRSSYYNGHFQIRARPLTLKEVIQLRDGVKTSIIQPYQILEILHNKKTLLSLN
jgi:hypothetical protein